MAEMLDQNGQQKALHAGSLVSDPVLHAVFAQCNCLLVTTCHVPHDHTSQEGSYTPSFVLTPRYPSAYRYLLSIAHI